MNRPKLENYHDIDLLSMPPIHKSAKDQYLIDLEKYCDWLEGKLECHKALVEFADNALAWNKEYKKALDKACEEIIKVGTNETDLAFTTAEECKAWYLEDE